MCGSLPFSAVSFVFRKQLVTACAPLVVSFLTVLPPSLHESPPAGSARLLEKLLPRATMARPAANSFVTRWARKRAATCKIPQIHLQRPSDVHCRGRVRRR